MVKLPVELNDLEVRGHVGREIERLSSNPDVKLMSFDIEREYGFTSVRLAVPSGRLGVDGASRIGYAKRMNYHPLADAQHDKVGLSIAVSRALKRLGAARRSSEGEK